MNASRSVPRVIIGGILACVLVLLAMVQFASDALYAQAATAGAFPTHLSSAFALRVYTFLERVAPAPYVEDTLGNVALARGELALAEHHAIRMPEGPRRDELLGRIALARGDGLLAQEYFFVAPDVDATQALIARIAVADPRTAYGLEARFRSRLMQLHTHPDAVAQAYWIAGTLDVRLNHAREAFENDETAVRLAPLNMTYVLAAANQALMMGDDATAATMYKHGLDVNPASGDALGGLGLVALHQGHRARAFAYAAQARAVAPHAAMLAVLERALR